MFVFVKMKCKRILMSGHSDEQDATFKVLCRASASKVSFSL